MHINTDLWFVDTYQYWSLIGWCQAATAADDADRMRKVLTSRATQDEERMSKLEEELKGIRNQAEDADKRYDEVQKKLQQVEAELERAEERAETGNQWSIYVEIQ